MTNEHTTPETDPIAQRLDALGAIDRASAPGSFERRIADAAMDAQSSAQTPAPIQIGARRVWLRPVGALAAAVLVVGAGAAAWFTLRPSPTPATNTESITQLASLEQDVDDLLALADLLDEHAGSWSGQLRSDADSLGDSIGRTWDALGTIADEYVEESI